MAQYRCYRVGNTGRYAAFECIEADSDEMAVALAKLLLAKRRRTAAFELWELARQEPVEAPEPAPR
jgi:hypothetical protein